MFSWIAATLRCLVNCVTRAQKGSSEQAPADGEQAVGSQEQAANVSRRSVDCSTRRDSSFSFNNASSDVALGLNSGPATPSPLFAAAGGQEARESAQAAVVTPYASALTGAFTPASSSIPLQLTPTHPAPGACVGGDSGAASYTPCSDVGGLSRTVQQAPRRALQEANSPFPAAVTPHTVCSGKAPKADSGLPAASPATGGSAGTLVTPAPAQQPFRRYMVDSGKIVGVNNTVARYHPARPVHAHTTPFAERVVRELAVEELLARREG